MLARRFLGCITVLVLLAVAGAFLFFQYGQQIIVSQSRPQGHFQAPAAGDTGPDYAKDASWVAKPGMSDDPTLWVPDGEVLTLSPNRAAAFYIHPTTYLGKARWNAAIDEGDDTPGRTTLFARSQSSVLNQVADIWAPHYRQAAFGAFLSHSDDSTKALDLAYSDVLRAFDAFLGAVPADRPIILAGHSQGSFHLLRLLRDRRDALKGRLVAAYAGGWPIGIGSDLPATGLSGCTAAAQSGCVVSWQSFADPANTSAIIDAWTQAPSLTGKRHQIADILCVNPVTGTSAPSAPAANPGTLVPNADLSKASLQAGAVGAMCRQGFLIIGGAIPAMGPYVLPGNNYHVYDYALFWKALRQDAARRLAAFEAAT